MYLFRCCNGHESHSSSMTPVDNDQLYLTPILRVEAPISKISYNSGEPQDLYISKQNSKQSSNNQQKQDDLHDKDDVINCEAPIIKKNQNCNKVQQQNIQMNQSIDHDLINDLQNDINLYESTDQDNQLEEISTASNILPLDLCIQDIISQKDISINVEVEQQENAQTQVVQKLNQKDSLLAISQLKVVFRLMQSYNYLAALELMKIVKYQDLNDDFRMLELYSNFKGYLLLKIPDQVNVLQLLCTELCEDILPHDQIILSSQLNFQRTLKQLLEYNHQIDAKDEQVDNCQKLHNLILNMQFESINHKLKLQFFNFHSRLIQNSSVDQQILVLEGQINYLKSHYQNDKLIIAYKMRILAKLYSDIQDYKQCMSLLKEVNLIYNDTKQSTSILADFQLEQAQIYRQSPYVEQAVFYAQKAFEKYVNLHGNFHPMSLYCQILIELSNLQQIQNREQNEQNLEQGVQSKLKVRKIIAQIVLTFERKRKLKQYYNSYQQKLFTNQQFLKDVEEFYEEKIFERQSSSEDYELLVEYIYNKK